MSTKYLQNKLENETVLMHHVQCFQIILSGTGDVKFCWGYFFCWVMRTCGGVTLTILICLKAKNGVMSKFSASEGIPPILPMGKTLMCDMGQEFGASYNLTYY